MVPPRPLRALSSGIGFTVFGLGSLVLVLLVFPLVWLFTRGRVRRTRRTRALIRHSFRWFITLLVVLRAIDVRWHHRERLAQAGPLLVIANHPSLIDVVLLAGWVPEAECVVKRDAWSNPFLGGVMRAADYIPNDDGEGLIAACVERLRGGATLILFPEGTRSPKGRLRDFKRGAARIALQAGCPVLLVDIDCRPPFLGKGDPWYQVPDELPCYTVTAHEPEPVRGPPDASQPPGGSEASAARRLSSTWRSGFEERLGHV